MDLVPFPGANEASVVAKVGSGVVSGLRQAGQLPPWPNARESLLELLAVLEEWSDRAEATTRYAAELSRSRTDTETDLKGISSTYSAGSNVGNTGKANIGRAYIKSVQRDARSILYGHVPLLARLNPPQKRKAMRRGLRTILAAYCPDLLKQFEKAMSDRVDWVDQHRREFDRWFDSTRTDEEIARFIADMDTTRLALQEAIAQLRGFIVTNFPLTSAPLSSTET
jgi:hypothetical protein